MICMIFVKTKIINLIKMNKKIRFRRMRCDDIEHLQSFFQFITSDQSRSFASELQVNQEAITHSSMHKHAWSYGLRIRSQKMFKNVELKMISNSQTPKAFDMQTKEGKLNIFMSY
jgi:hypothetical protein